jgi:flagellar basal-body rod modification protein FlgD
VEIQSVTGGYDSAFITQAAAGETMGKDEFLRLLVTQLRHQDPLNPLDNAEFVAQLAQFSSLEQMQNLNQQFADQAGLIRSLNNSMAAAMVGREVVVSSDNFAVSGGETPRIGVYLGSAAESVRVTLRDASGTAVRSFDLGALAAGHHSVEWDGRDAQGRALAEGGYMIEVTAADAAGEALAGYPVISGRVESVLYENGAAYFSVAGTEVPLAALLEVLQDSGQGQ